MEPSLEKTSSTPPPPQAEAEIERTKKKWLDLAEEVVVEIMSFLPPKSLTQFKLVNRSWCAFIESLISDPLFVAKHLYNMKNNLLLYSTSLAFICKVPCSCDEPELITTLANSTNELVHSPSCPQYVRPHLLTLFHGHDHDDDDHQIRHVVEDFDLPLIWGDTELNGITEYHCNGLVCLTREVSDYPDYVLCNPSTKKWRLLPDLINRFRFARLGGGLGCDSRDKDYKFVRFGYHLDSKDSIAEIYILGTDSWREIKFDWSEMKFGFKVTDVMADEVDKEILCRGVLYWVVQGHKIMCFDVSDEVFRSLPLPDNLQSSKKLSSFPKQIRLAVWNEAVALFHYPSENGVVRSIEIWVMMDDCIGGIESSCSWFKQVTIGPLVGIGTPLTFWNGDELLMRIKDRRLVSYNLPSQKLRRLSTGVGRKASKTLYVYEEDYAFLFVKSLVSVEGGSGREA